MLIRNASWSTALVDYWLLVGVTGHSAFTECLEPTWCWWSSTRVAGVSETSRPLSSLYSLFESIISFHLSVRPFVCLVPICGGSTAARTGRPFRLSWLAIFDRPSPFQNPVFANARCGESRALKRVRCTTLHTMVDTPTRGLQQSSRKLVNSRISTTNRALVVCLCAYLETSRNEKNGKSNEYKTQIGRPIGLLENQTLVQKPSKL